MSILFRPAYLLLCKGFACIMGRQKEDRMIEDDAADLLQAAGIFGEFFNLPGVRKYVNFRYAGG